MKNILTFFIVALCLIIIVTPVTAAREDQGAHPGITIAPAADHNQDQIDRKGSDDRMPNTSAARETIRGERTDVRADAGEINRSTTHTIPGLQNDTAREQERSNASNRNVTPVRAGWTKNENAVRAAVHTLLAMDNVTGGIGPQVSALARDFNNSARSTEQLETRISNRDAFSKLFFGGDRDAAGELVTITAKNRAGIQQIQRLMNTTTMDADTQAMMDQQLQVLLQEQDRLDQLALQTEQDRGLFGWMNK
jgi:hypothetical protein